VFAGMIVVTAFGLHFTPLLRGLPLIAEQVADADARGAPPAPAE